MTTHEERLARIVRRLPRHQRERYAEEWAADLAGCRSLGLDPDDVLDGAEATARWLRRRDLWRRLAVPSGWVVRSLVAVTVLAWGAAHVLGGEILHRWGAAALSACLGVLWCLVALCCVALATVPWARHRRWGWLAAALPLTWMALSTWITRSHGAYDVVALRSLRVGELTTYVAFFAVLSGLIIEDAQQRSCAAATSGDTRPV